MKTPPSSLTYHEKLRQADKEAAYTLAFSALVTAFFWISIFLTSDTLLVFFGLPLWFWLSCIGGYVFSIVAVLLLIRLCFKNFDLESTDELGERK